MDKPLPFFNWSLKKAQNTEPDSFAKARIGIIYTLILFSLLKILVVIGIGVAYAQWLQVYRAIGMFAIYLVLLKVLLYKPSALKTLAHIMINLGILIVWSNIFFFAHKINLLTVQFVFMIALSSFYALSSGSGILYSSLSIFPVMLFLLFRGSPAIYFTNTPQEFASPGFEIIVALNFISIIMAHYLFFEGIKVHVKEKENLNRQLQLSIIEANKLAVSKSNFLSTMSHELRTPLNSVIGITELLLDDQPEERQKDNLKILQFSALDLLSLINNVLDFNKIDSNKLVLESVPFRLIDFIQNIVSALRVKTNNKNIALILDIDKRLENTTVLSDPIRLSQVIYNLVGNAVKFTDKGAVTVKLCLANSMGNTVNVLFSVADTGIGISPDKHETIFELFTQAGANVARTYGGTGLGLAIVKQVLVLFNSTIQLESSPGNGARFFFTIPFTTVEAALEKDVAERSQVTDLSHLRILVAEDNGVNRLLMKKQMDRLQITPVIVENGVEALEACRTHNFDAIFMDLHMPEMDGYEAIKHIRALPDSVKANVHIIAFTATVTEKEKIVGHGFNDFLYKPVSLNDLRDKLEQVYLSNSVG